MDSPKLTTPIISCAIDNVAYASLRAEREDEDAEAVRCHVCDGMIRGRPPGAGLLLWTRGDEVRFDSPPLCEECAANVGIAALMRWELEESEG
ncbi:MAG: hypothetical protein JRI23_26345 [Deltaproteobacteria bacterium]|jgi:hypothetical protein|nr:hypothetical protein [Deltaproteobacteria bacterium]MBW2535556.1 hypothetical protein [Deltaproteobacteria bacterium]